MKIQINKFIKDVDGCSPIIIQGNVITVKNILIASILTPIFDKKGGNGDVLEVGDSELDKKEKYRIYKNIQSCGESEDGMLQISIEDVAIIKKAVGKTQPQLIMGQVFEILEGEDI